MWKSIKECNKKLALSCLKKWGQQTSEICIKTSTNSNNCTIRKNKICRFIPGPWLQEEGKNLRKFFFYTSHNSEYEYKKVYDDKVYNTRDENGNVIIGPKPFYTSGMKRGKGNTTAGLLFSSHNYLGSPYDNQKDFLRQ